MKSGDILEDLGLDRAVSVNLNFSELPEEQALLLAEIQAKNFGVDKVYFSSEKKDGEGFPTVFIKKVETFDFNTLQEIQEIHRKIWNFKKILFLYVYSDVEIRIYNCTEKPILTKPEIQEEELDKKLQKLEISTYTLTDGENLEQLKLLFSRFAIDSGIIWNIPEAKFIRDKINLQNRVDKFLVRSFIKTANQLTDDGVKLEFIYRIILRSLFLLYLEDRGATDEEFYSKIKKGTSSYLDILDDVNATYQLFQKLEKHFNGNVFTVQKGEKITQEQLKIIKNCLINGNDGTDQILLFENLRLFDFSIIQIELLSEIYENFLFETDPEIKKKSGSYYTPPSLVGFILNEKLPSSKKNIEYQVKILDPSCGSGIFLVQSFKRLVKRYENKHQKKPDFETLRNILTENIYGIEINSQAIKVAAFSLYLALVDNLNPKTLWQSENYKLPYLINDPEDETIPVQGNNLFCRDAILTNEEIEKIDFQLVVGNPPFGTKNRSDSIKKYCKHHKFAQEMVLPFLHKAVKFAPEGEIALIFNTKILTNTGGTYQNFRRWLFNKCYVEKVFNFSILRKAHKKFGGQLFGGATGPISIIYYRKEIPENPKDKIIYYAPKTFIKTNVFEGLSMDATDIKYLPRKECQKPDTKIWKVAMWGGMQDWNLIQKLQFDYISLNKLFKNKNVDYGVGFELSSPKDKTNYEIRKLPVHTPHNVDYYKSISSRKFIDDIKFRRLGKLEAYQNPHVLYNEGVKSKNGELRLLASFVDYKSAYTKGIVGIYSKNNDIELLKLITAFLNSTFIKYYAFLVTSSWGIERDVVKHKELFEAPNILDDLSFSAKENLIHLLDNELIDETFESINKQVETEINKIILSVLSDKDITLIEDSLMNLDLFHRQENSVALHPITFPEIKEYAEVICQEQNQFLGQQDLFLNATLYKIGSFSPLMMIKLSFDKEDNDIFFSEENVSDKLKDLDKHLWEQNAPNIYFRKKLNYKTKNEIYLIRPNQKRFWSKSMAREDSNELILEILNEN